MEHRCILLIAAAVLPALVLGGQDTNICSPGKFQPVGAAKPFPPLPDKFSAVITMDVIANKTTKTLYELFDAPNNRAFLAETEATGTYKNISLTGMEMYNFYSNQILELIQLPDGTFFCQTMVLNGRGSDTFIFGDAASSTTGFTAKSAFMINSAFPPAYQGKQTLADGQMLEVWKDCHYIAALDATVTAEWFFTDSDDWTSPLGVQIPVMLKVQGKTYQYNPQGRVINHVYKFSGFRDFITDEEQTRFQIPKGTVCPFMKGFDVKTATVHQLPPIATDGYFSFEAELVQQTAADTGLVTDFKEYYDSTLMLSRFDYTPQGIATSFFDAGAASPIKEVHDFLTGLAYKIDKNKGNCTVVPLSQSPNWDVQVDPTNTNHVRMKTVKEFFFVAGTAGDGTGLNWTYTGQRKLRDITADIYVAERLGWPAGTAPDTKSIWEIAFTSVGYLDVASSELDSIQAREIMRIWMKIPAINYEMTYNIFNFDESEPDSWTYDVKECFPDDQKTNVHFRLPGDKKDTMETHRKEFTYWLLVDILGYLDISPIRVSGLEWFAADNNDDIIVQFKIIDPPTMAGSTNDQIPTNYLNPTADAVALLKAAVDQGKFIVEVGGLDINSNSKTNVQSVTAIKGSVEHGGKTITKTVTVKEVQLDAGAAAGIAIAFLVVGAAIGVLVIFVVNKVKGGNLPNLSMSFSPRIYENSS